MRKAAVEEPVEEFIKEVEILKHVGKQGEPLTEQNPLIQISSN